MVFEVFRSVTLQQCANKCVCPQIHVHATQCNEDFTVKMSAVLLRKTDRLNYKYSMAPHPLMQTSQPAPLPGFSYQLSITWLSSHVCVQLPRRPEAVFPGGL